ncbi:hypothetical protein VNO78_24455 [Psophocarpus tetragonolobus]|uniref:Uncharacterized protein n=1 Tax=Psophocarpus tetragonolobus TaxID=3891 RepID=A0AAN9S545_PSOTE
MEHRKTLTMDWDGLGDVEDEDTFFESYNRLSTATSLDAASSSDEEDDGADDSRLSFASAFSSFHSCKIRASTPNDPPPDCGTRASFSIGSEYGIWMAAPTSIDERRKRLFHGMGLDDDKEFSKAPNVTISKNINPVPSSNSSEKPTLVTTSTPITTTPVDSSVSSKKETEHSSVHLVLVRSRSEGDIQLFSIEKIREEDLIGKGLKPRLMRTTTEVAFSRSRNETKNRAVVRDFNEMAQSEKSTAKIEHVTEDSGSGAFFVIKNLDTGKEFVVNEYGENGMWNRLSDLQTGKQLTMEEFERAVGKSRVVNELMRRGGRNDGFSRKLSSSSYISRSLRMSKRRGVALLKNIKGVASGFMSDREREGSLVSIQPTQEGKNQWVRVRQSGKSHKELSALHLCQEFQAHEGCIWTIKFSFDGRYLASAGEDKVIHLWEVQECEVLSLRVDEGSLTPIHPSLLASNEAPPLSLKKKGKFGSKRGTTVPEYVHVPETVFSLSDKPYCSFHGHSDDVLDLSWSKSQLLLSSSMDKTVRLWDLETKTCLNKFAHNDYGEISDMVKSITCIQFNPMDDDHFISGSLDAKVRIWNIPERHVADWTDIREMVTAVSYTPDGRGALVGTHKGVCLTYDTKDCVLTQTGTIEIRHKKKSHLRKITGFQFVPGKPSEVLITSSDSRIRLLDGSEIVQKFRGFRNANSQIAASFSSDGRYIVSASEDSQVYVWKHEENRSAGSGKGKNVLVTRSHEHFQCKDVSVAILWPCTIRGDPPLVPAHHSKRHSKRFQAPNYGEETSSPSSAKSKKSLPPLPRKSNNNAIEGASNSPREGPTQILHTDSRTNSRVSLIESVPRSPMKVNYQTTEENFEVISRTDSGFSDSFSSGSPSARYGDSLSSCGSVSSSYSLLDSSHISSSVLPSAWGLVIVTASFGGEIKCYQNFGLPRRMGRPPHLFGGHNSFSHGNM